MHSHAHLPVGEIAALFPHAAKLFDLFNIDYILHGDLALADACSAAGAELPVVRHALDTVPAEGLLQGWSEASTPEIVDELRDHRHPYLRSLLNSIASALSRAATPEIIPVKQAFGDLYAELGPHMTREEHVLFPVVQHLEGRRLHDGRGTATLMCGTRKLLPRLFREHMAIMKCLETLRAVAAGVKSEEPAWRQAVDLIEALHREMREHVHIENNVLYVRAVALEAALEG